MRHTIGKLLRRATMFFLELISIGGLHTKLWAPKVVMGVLAMGISGLPLGSFGTK